MSIVTRTLSLQHRQTIDEILGATVGMYAPSFWLATDNYEDAPKKKPYWRSEGTIPPIPKDFTSPWIGRNIRELVQWLKDEPEETDLNGRHFAVLDKGARDESPTVVCCRFGDLHAQGDKLYLVRESSVGAVEHLVGAASDTWDEVTRRGKRNAEIEYDD